MSQILYSQTFFIFISLNLVNQSIFKISYFTLFCLFSEFIFSFNFFKASFFISSVNNFLKVSISFSQIIFKNLSFHQEKSVFDLA